MSEDIKSALECMQLQQEYIANFSELIPPTRRIVPKGVISYTIGTEKDTVRILPIGDIHLGSKYCNEDVFVKFVNYITYNEDIYVVLVGDLAESATRISVGAGPYEEKYQVGTQRKIIQKLLEPIAKSGRIICGVSGNHEQRVQMFNNDNPMEELCYDLEIPYAGYQGFVKFTANDQRYDMMIFHGSGGGTTKGAKATSATKPNQIANVDIYITGHTHDQLYMTDQIFEIMGDELVARKRHYVVCGSFLEYFGGYPEMKGLPPVNIGAPLLTLNTKNHLVRCEM